MSTARAAKREIMAGLLDAIPGLSGRVYQARVWPMKLPELPAVLIYGWTETKTRKTIDFWSHQFDVSCMMAIEGRVQALDGPSLEIAMENLAGDIEAAILTAPELIGLNGAIEGIDRVDTKLEKHPESEIVQGSVSIGFNLLWTEIHQVTVPAGEVTGNFAIKSFPTTFL